MTGIPLDDINRRQSGEESSPSSAPATSQPQAASSTTLAQPAPWFVEWATGMHPGEGGPVVNEQTALTYATLYSCVSLIAKTIASLPFKVYRRRPDGGQDELPDRPEYNLLQTQFNPNTSAMTGREATTAHLMTWGNSYTQIVRGKSRGPEPGKVLQLQPLGPDIVHPKMNKAGELEYEVRSRSTGEVLEVLPREEVLHVPGLTFDSLVGYSTVRISRHTIRTGVAQDREAERFVTRGIRPPGAIKMQPGKKFADEKQAMKFRDSFRRLHSVEDGSLQIIILEDGMEWQALGFDPEKAQLLESRQFTAVEICGLYHVPPHLVGLVDKTSSWGTGVAEMTTGFVVYCLLPILRAIEQEYDRKLFAATADKGVFCEHVLTGLLRGDPLKRAEALEKLFRNGIVTRNEWRRMEGFNPVRGGNVFFWPLTMGRTDADTGEDIPPPAPAEVDSETGPGKPEPNGKEPPAGKPKGPAPGSGRDPEQSARLASALRKNLVAAAGRCLRKEAAEARRAAKKPAEFLAWADGFYSARYTKEVEESIRPALEAWQAAFPVETAAGEDWPAASALSHVARSHGELLDLAGGVNADGLAEAVEKVVSRWQTDRLAELAAEFSEGVTSHAV